MRRLFGILFAAFIVATLAIFWFGDTGIFAYRGLSAYRDRLAANVASLSSLNETLSDELASLQDDPERVEVMARDLGLFKDGDRVIRLTGADPHRVSYEVGNLLKLAKPKEPRTPWLKTSLAGAAAVACALLVLLRGIRRKKGAHDRPRRRF
jgi:cell division protein FtsB